MSKLEEIAYELKNLWQHLSRQELCEYYDVTERTLCNYKNKLNLPKNNCKGLTTTNPISVYINTPDNSIKKQIFKSWNHFVIWSKAQSHPFVISDQNVINIDYNRETLDAQKYRQMISR